MGGDAGGVGSERDERGIVFAVRRGEICAADVLAAEAAQGIWAGAGREQLPGQISPVCWRRRGERSRVHRALVVELGGGVRMMVSNRTQVGLAGEVLRAMGLSQGS